MIEQSYVIPSKPVDDKTVFGIIENAAELITSGLYDGVEPNGEKCTAGAELEKGHLQIISPLTRIDFNAPFDPTGELAGPIFIPYYSYVKPTPTTMGEMELVIAQNTRGSERLVVYKVVGKGGVPFSVEGAEGYPDQSQPLEGQSVAILHRYPICSNLVKHTLVIGKGTSNAYSSTGSGCDDKEAFESALPEAKSNADADAIKQCNGKAARRSAEYQVGGEIKLRGALCIVHAQATYTCEQ